ncbi:mate-domain-containing protein [Dunaliella salina]|uniref:Protein DETOXIFICATION n=1 Tax=Dunaliella salina TaxID=3046 RepID=A0ABQ7GTK0_DUNSA|nr:mate-domain-containing protein [Dunaliella salina]|eukprot:KAF5837931.1 mate-domain-containing protein [Dunaliella salina]
MDEPLLPPQVPEHTYSSTSVPRGRTASELWATLQLSVPVSVAELLSFASTVTSTAYVGTLGPEALSAWTLARTLFHVSGLAIVTGLASAQTTFSGQAYGAGRYSTLGVQMQRVATLSLLVAAASVAAWWYGAETIIVHLGQASSLVHPAAACLRIMAPALFLKTIWVTIKNYLACQGVMTPQTIITAKLLLVTPAVNQVFIHRLGYGLRGAAYAYNFLTALEVGMLVLCVGGHQLYMRRFDPGKATWSGWAIKAALSSWGPYLRIALPSCAMICLNWWCYEVMIIIAGLQRDAETQLGAMGVLFSTHALAFMVASGFGVAVATRVSNELGAKRPEAGRRAMLVASACSLATATGVGILLTAFRNGWAHLYSQEPLVANMVIESMPLLSLSLLFDALNVVLSGVLRGCGYQMIGFVANLSTFWAFGVPAASYMALPWGANMGVYGIWIALLSVSALQAAVLCLICFAGFNFEDLVQFSQVLLAEDNFKGQSRRFEFSGSGREVAREGIWQDGVEPRTESNDVRTCDVQGRPSSSGASHQPSFVVL